MTLQQDSLSAIKDAAIIGDILKTYAQTKPDAPALQWQAETPFTYRQLYDHCLKVAGALRQLGVKEGDTVLLMLPNCLEIVFSWFGINFLGAVEVPINIHYKGSFLVHEANDCGAKVAVIHHSYYAKFHDVRQELKHIEKMVIVGGGADKPEGAGWGIMGWDEMIGGAQPIAEPVARHYSDTAAIMYTSGTTGPSKGVIMPYGLCGVFARAIIEVAQLGPEDVYYVCLPLFHANAQFMQVLPALAVGARVCLWPTFSASQFLDQVRQCGATVTNTLGVMCEFIYRQPRRPDDEDNPLRAMITIPAPADIAEDFEKRFRVKCLEGYGMTETSVFTYRRMGEPLRLGSAGRPLPWYEVQIGHPETDEPLPPGEIGEIMVRPKHPWIIMKGYLNLPEKTLETWRNFWFHTGDLGKMDEDGYLYFIDRLKDAIRRRGENISSYTVESVVNNHPAVAESAAVAVPSEHGAGGEDEVKIFVVLKPGATVTPLELHEYCVKNMPYFAVPRFIEFIDHLPKTPNEKVRKAELRKIGNTEKTWDREAAGIQLQK